MTSVLSTGFQEWNFINVFSEQLKEQYKGKLEKRMSGTVFEVVSKIFRVMVDMKITVPGSFVGYLFLFLLLSVVCNSKISFERILRNLKIFVFF